MTQPTPAPDNEPDYYGEILGIAARIHGVPPHHKFGHSGIVVTAATTALSAIREALADKTGPAFIAAMPPSIETSRRWWTMYCHTCGVEEMLAKTPDDPALLARVREHNITRHSSSTIHQALSDAFLDADTILPDGGDPRGQANLLADIALRLIRPRPEISMDGKPVEPPVVTCSNHHPTQHRDGRAPWCRECGLDAKGKEPRGILGDRSRDEPLEYRLTFYNDCGGDSVVITTDADYASTVARDPRAGVEQRRHGSTDDWEPTP